MDIGERIQQAREMRGVSRAELAAKIGIVETAIRKLENAESKSPTFANGVQLAKHLGIWPDELSEGKPFPSDLAFSFSGSRVEVRIRIHGDAEHAAVIAALRTAVASIDATPNDERLAALNLRLERLHAEIDATAKEIRRFTGG